MQNRGCSIGDNRHGASSIFLIYGKNDKELQRHNKSLNSSESYVMPKVQDNRERDFM